MMWDWCDPYEKSRLLYGGCLPHIFSSCIFPCRPDLHLSKIESNALLLLSRLFWSVPLRMTLVLPPHFLRGKKQGLPHPQRELLGGPTHHTLADGTPSWLRQHSSGPSCRNTHAQLLCLYECISRHKDWLPVECCWFKPTASSCSAVSLPFTRALAASVVTHFLIVWEIMISL